MHSGRLRVNADNEDVFNVRLLAKRSSHDAGQNSSLKSIFLRKMPCKANKILLDTIFKGIYNAHGFLKSVVVFFESFCPF